MPTAARRSLGSGSSQWSTGAQSSVASAKCCSVGRVVTTWWVRVRSKDWPRVRGMLPVTSRTSWPSRWVRAIASSSGLIGGSASGWFHSGSAQSWVSSSRGSVINVPRPPNWAVGRAQVYTARHATATSGQRNRKQCGRGSGAHQRSAARSGEGGI